MSDSSNNGDSGAGIPTPGANQIPVVTYACPIRKVWVSCSPMFPGFQLTAESREKAAEMMAKYAGACVGTVMMGLITLAPPSLVKVARIVPPSKG